MTVIERRKALIAIFNHTEELCDTHPILISSVEGSLAGQTVFIGNDFQTLPLAQETDGTPARVIVSGKRSLEAARAYAEAGKKVCVLNFADWHLPGGWVKRGSSAQEESLCRCSTLYPCISHPAMVEAFYEPHRSMKKEPLHILHNDDLIYTPGVTVFKSDSVVPELLPEEEWYSVDVISCAAPRLRLRSADQKKLNLFADVFPMKPEELIAIFSRRIRCVFEAASRNRAQVLILGAFGCGAFRNPPEVVAQAFEQVIREYLHKFDTIEFPVFYTAKNPGNYEVFCRFITQR